MSDEIPSAEYRRINRYVEKVGTILHIHWDLYIHPAYSPDVDYLARVIPTPNRHTAVIDIGADWQGLTSGEKREVIVHELLHVMNSKVNQFVSDVVAPSLPKKARLVSEEQYENLDEQFIDRLAFAVAALMPEWA